MSMVEKGGELGLVLSASGQAPEAQKALGSRKEEQWGPTGLMGQGGASSNSSNLGEGPRDPILFPLASRVFSPDGLGQDLRVIQNPVLRLGLRSGPWGSLGTEASVEVKFSCEAPPPTLSGSKSGHQDSKSLRVQADRLPRH